MRKNLKWYLKKWNNKDKKKKPTAKLGRKLEFDPWSLKVSHFIWSFYFLILNFGSKLLFLSCLSPYMLWKYRKSHKKNENRARIELIGHFLIINKVDFGVNKIILKYWIAWKWFETSYSRKKKRLKLKKVLFFYLFHGISW